MKTQRQLVTELKKQVREISLKNFYKSTSDYTIFANKDSSGLTINVTSSAGWLTDVNNDNVFKLMDGGKERARITWREGNVAQVAKEMYKLNEKAGGEEQGLKVQDYVNILNMYTKAKSEAQK